ncbi:MAG TPA: DUF5715 family protein [Pyrinomonadaceae bacterium]|nr:DUF5715 family protein [Pyrinomonadaceae bacterium]
MSNYFNETTILLAHLVKIFRAPIRHRAPLKAMISRGFIHVNIARKQSYILLLLALALALSSGCRRERHQTIMPAPVTAPPAMIDPWQEAALKVEEDRGEPVGRQAKVEVPAQLKHYEDPRRFLGIQVAEWRKQKLQTPHDFADLISLVRRGELVELPALGQNYILYGVGYSATDEPFTHYDKAAGKSVTLYADDAELEQEQSQIADSLKLLEETVAGLTSELKAAPRGDRALRTRLLSEVSENERAMKALKERKKLLDSFYGNEDARRLLAAEYEIISTHARDFGGRAYDLQDAAARKAFKVRLLSHLRPAALKVLEEIAKTYRDKFGRPLAVTSLVRPDEYQRQLRATNANATLIEVPPHTTGLAFDLYYRYMNAAEQTFIMSELGRLQDEGRIEVLRENRDHYHVFAFADGRRPGEDLIKQTLNREATAQKSSARKETSKEKKSPAKSKTAKNRRPRRPQS